MFWSKDLAIYFLWNSLCFDLASLAFSLDWSITAYFLNFLKDLRSHFFGIHYSVKLLFISLDVSSTSDILEVNQVINICGSFISSKSRVHLGVLVTLLFFVRDIFEVMADSSAWLLVLIEILVGNLNWHIEGGWSHWKVWFNLLSSVFNWGLYE